MNQLNSNDYTFELLMKRFDTLEVQNTLQNVIMSDHMKADALVQAIVVRHENYLAILAKFTSALVILLGLLLSWYEFFRDFFKK